jgi:hypothetical protein
MGFWLEVIGLILLIAIVFGIIIYGTYWSFAVISKFFSIPMPVLAAFLILYVIWIKTWITESKSKIKSK